MHLKVPARGILAAEPGAAVSAARFLAGAAQLLMENFMAAQ